MCDSWGEAEALLLHMCKIHIVQCASAHINGAVEQLENFCYSRPKWALGPGVVVTHGAMWWWPLPKVCARRGFYAHRQGAAMSQRHRHFIFFQSARPLLGNIPRWLCTLHNAAAT